MGLFKRKPAEALAVASEPEIVEYANGKGTDSPWHMDTLGLPAALRSRERSKTFPGIAKAMASQWGRLEA